MWSDLLLGTGSGILANLISAPLIALLLYIWKEFKTYVAKDYIAENEILQQQLKEKDRLIDHHFSQINLQNEILMQKIRELEEREG